MAKVLSLKLMFSHKFHIISREIVLLHYGTVVVLLPSLRLTVYDHNNHCQAANKKQFSLKATAGSESECILIINPIQTVAQQ